jgi:hypothetical protein
MRLSCCFGGGGDGGGGGGGGECGRCPAHAALWQQQQATLQQPERGGGCGGGCCHGLCGSAGGRRLAGACDLLCGVPCQAEVGGPVLGTSEAVTHAKQEQAAAGGGRWLRQGQNRHRRL